MAFTHAIYYPWIDIEDSAWLKTAILYWDKISTIVPSYMDKPYNNPDCAYLESVGVVIPEFVQPGQGIVEEASSNFLNYLSSSEAKRILLPPRVNVLRLPSVDTTIDVARVNKWKLGDELTKAMIRSGRVREDGEWLIFDKQSVNYYMALLAAGISSSKHFAPLTNDGVFESISNKVKRGDEPNIKKQHLGEALLAHMTLETVCIAEDTPLETILTFRADYSDEIGRFRAAIGGFAEKIDPETPSFEALEQQVTDIYKNEIEPAIKYLRKALAGRKFRLAATQLTSIIFAQSISSLALDAPLNIAVSASCMIVGNAINYLIDRKQDLMSNPYSYILSAQSQFS